jgi:hypothetical protein
MIKYKFYAFIIQFIIVLIFLMFNWGGQFLFIPYILINIGLTGVILIPFSMLSDLIYKRLNRWIALPIACLIHLGASTWFSVASQGLVLSMLIGGSFWLADESIKWRLRLKDR